MELNREFVERFHLNVFALLDKLNQQYREEIDSIHVFERISTAKQNCYYFRRRMNLPQMEEMFQH